MPMSGGANCDGLETAGFRLLRIDAHDGGETKRLHEDKTIPQSRGCPNGYSIGAVQTFSPSGLSAYAVLIAVRGRGFERSEEHTSELPSLMRISYAVFCLK